MGLNRWARRCHRSAQTWWHDPATGARLARNKGEIFMLILSEISEAMEGERKDLMDDKLPHRKMAEVECADALIRLLDYGGAYGVNYDQMMAPARYGDLYTEGSLNKIGRRLYKSNVLLYDVTTDKPVERNRGELLFEIARSVVSGNTFAAICDILTYAAWAGYDIDGAIAEKLAYNARRADHKPLARLAAGGKRW